MSQIHNNQKHHLYEKNDLFGYRSLLGYHGNWF